MENTSLVTETGLTTHLFPANAKINLHHKTFCGWIEGNNQQNTEDSVF